MEKLDKFFKWGAQQCAKVQFAKHKNKTKKNF